MTPRELFEQGLKSIFAKDMTAFSDLWAVDGVLELPFAPPGYPRRLDGRAAVHEHLRDYPKVFDVRELADLTVHETTDPEVIVAEFEIAGVRLRSGTPYRSRYIAVITVRDNEIVHYRDYWNPLAAAAGDGP